jgi:hypothetical protein
MNGDNNSVKWIDERMNNIILDNHMDLMNFAEEFYQEGLSCFDFIEWVKETTKLDNLKKNEIIVCFNTIKSEFRSEKLLLLYLLDYLYLRSNPTLKSVFTI